MKYNVEDCEDEDELQEMSPTANAPGYQTPHAFMGDDNKKRKKIASINKGMTIVNSIKENNKRDLTGDGTIDSKDYMKAKDNAIKKAIKKESNYAQTMKEIYGLNYPSFKKNENLNSRQKVNGAIKEINSRLFKMERVINRATKLKNESGITSENYWKSTQGRVQQIAERLLSVARTLKEFKN